jgi:hypothetical protein
MAAPNTPTVPLPPGINRLTKNALTAAHHTCLKRKPKGRGGYLNVGIGVVGLRAVYSLQLKVCSGGVWYFFPITM